MTLIQIRARSAGDEAAIPTSTGARDNAPRASPTKGAQAMEAATAENLRSRAAEEEADRDLSDTAEFPPGQPIEEDEGFPPDDEEDSQDEDDARRPPMGSRINFGELQFGQDYEIT